MASSPPPRLFDAYLRAPTREHVIWGTIGAYVIASVLSGVVVVLGGSTSAKDVLSPPVFLLSLLVVSATFAFFAILFARRAPEGLRQRLLLVRPNIPGRLLLLLLPASWAAWTAGIPLELVGEWLFGKSDMLEGFIQSYASAPWGWKVGFLLTSTLGPGIGEELLFRGYLQHGLLKARGKSFAIVFTAFAFSLGHLPPARVLQVLPFAFWLGFLALRTGSLIPGIVCHIFVNLTGHVVLANGLDPGIVIAPAFILGLPALVIALYSLRRLSRVPPASTERRESGQESSEDPSWASPNRDRLR